MEKISFKKFIWNPQNMSTNYFELSVIDKHSINTNHHSCPTNTLVAKHGKPRTNITEDCMPVTNQYWRSKMVTKNVGPFNLTGFHLFLDVLEKMFIELKSVHPDLYSILRSAGCLCCRKVRGSVNTLSNHGLGFAVDFEMWNPSTGHNELDERGDGKVQHGMLVLYSIAKKYNLYWGAGFPTEDGMHFEVSNELVQQWISKGLL